MKIDLVDEFGLDLSSIQGQKPDQKPDLFDEFGLTPPEKPGVLGTLTEGAKSAGRAVGSTFDTYTGNSQGVVDKAEAQQYAPKNEKLEKFYSDIEEHTAKSKAELPEGEDIGVGTALKNVGKAVVDNPGGAGLAAVEQLPNSVPALAGGWAGMKMGGAAGTAVAPFLGPAAPAAPVVGAIVGGLAGMFLGNTLIETGHKAMSAADDGEYTPEEMEQVKREGAVKAGVITGVDAVTLGLGGAVSGAMQRTTRKALEGATRKALIDNGIDVADEAAVAAARSNPQISAAVREAQESAIRATDTLKRRAAESGILLSMETVGESLGEYLGELAATGEADITDAVLEGMLSLGQSGAETAWNMSRKRDHQGLWDAAGGEQSPEGDALPESGPAPDLVVPEPTPENPLPAPVPRPDPANGPLSAAASLLPSASPEVAQSAPDTPTPNPADAPMPTAAEVGALSSAAARVTPEAMPAPVVDPVEQPTKQAAEQAQQPQAVESDQAVTPSQRALLRRHGLTDDDIASMTRQQAGELLRRRGKSDATPKSKQEQGKAPEQLTLEAQNETPEQLREHLSYLERQARASGGWTPSMAAERSRIRDALGMSDGSPAAPAETPKLVATEPVDTVKRERPVSIVPLVQVSEDTPPSKERNRDERIRKLQDQGFEVVNETHNTYEGAVGRASQLNSAKDGYAYFARQVGFGTKDGGEYIVLRTPAEGGFKQGSEVDKLEEGQRWMTPSGQIITVSRTEDSSKPGMARDAMRDRQRGTFKINGRDETYLLSAMDNYLLLGSDTKQSADAGDSAISDADGYKARSADRLERINKATSKDEIDEILKEHASDPAGHMDGYSRMEAKAKDAKYKIDNPPRTDLVEGYTNPSPRQAQMDVDRLNETNPGHELVRMQGEWGEYYAIKKPSASQGKGQGPRSSEQPAADQIPVKDAAPAVPDVQPAEAAPVSGNPGAKALRAKKAAPADQATVSPETVTAPAIEGRDLGDGWAAFTSESGTIGVPRADMPQIKAEHRGALVNFLNARGIEHQEETVPSTSLKPTQAEFSKSKVEQAKNHTGSNRAILVSSDNHVLDGHHQWLAARENGDDVRIIRLDAPIEDLLTAAHEFPSSTTDTAAPGAQPAEAAPVKWFASKAKAEAHIAKKKLGATHQVVKNGNRYEIHPVPEQERDLIVQQPPADQATPAAEQQGEQGPSESAAVNDFIAGRRDTPPTLDEVASEGEQKAAIARHGLPADTAFKEGKGLAAGKWIAQSGEASSNPNESIDAAAADLKKWLDQNRRAEGAEAKKRETAQTVAEKLRRGEQPTDAELKLLFGLEDGWTYVKQPAVGWFLVEYMGVPRHKIRASLGKAAGTVTSDSGTKYPIVYPRKLHEVFAEVAQAGSEAANVASAAPGEAGAAGADAGQEAKAPEIADPRNDIADGTPVVVIYKRTGQTVDVGIYRGINARTGSARIELAPGAIILRHPDAYEIRPMSGDGRSQAPAEKSEPEQKSEQSADLQARHERIDQAIDQLTDAEVEDLYRRSGLAGAHTSAEQKRNILKREHPDDIEPLLNQGQAAEQAAQEPEANPQAQPEQEAQQYPIQLKDGSKALGRRPDGKMIYEDEKGVRYYTDRGVRISEPVGLVPTREGIRKQRGALRPEFMTAAEQEQEQVAQQPAPEAQPAPAEQDLARQLAGMSNADLSALIDEIAAEDSQVADTAKPAPKRKRKTQPKAEGATPKPRDTTSPAESADENDAADVERTASEIAKSFGYNVSSAGMEAIKGLTALFGGAGKLSSGLTFDEETYAKAKPHFQAMLRDAQAAGHDLAEFVRTVLRSFGTGVKPYIIRFANDLRDEVQAAGETNERAAVRDNGPQALDDVAAEESGSPESGRGAGASAPDSGQAGSSEGSGADAARVSAARSGRSGAKRSGASQARARRKQGAVGDSGGAGAEQAVPGDDGRVTVAGEPSSPPNIPSKNFVITDDVQLGAGGEVQKFNDNLAAIRTLKAIEAQNRRATPEEQAVLARYVGWGGLASAFPDPVTGKFKDKWEARGEALRELLTDDEYQAARRSTRNAHYTSQTVVSAMWKAVERLGFRGGLVLESSMGVGNFVGLAPQNIPAKFIGVEYDSLTARMAQALYPQATVLHSGFQDVPLSEGAFALNIGNPPFGSESLRFQFKPELNGVSIHNQFFRAGMDALRPGGIQAMVVSRYLMDAQDKSTRLALAKQARLLGAIRLPDTAFKENARTEVVTDIIFLQKLTEAEQAEMAEAIEAYRNQKPNKQPSSSDAELIAKVPSWVETATVPDPLGGEAMTVNRYFSENPQNIMGVLERSGSMQHGADITVRLDNPEHLAERLDKAIERLPANVQRLEAEVLEATEARFKSMSDALRIALANEEVGHLKYDADGKIQRVIERETPEGGYEYALQEITPDSPWSEQLSLDAAGRWYRLDVLLDEKGNKVKKIGKDGKATRLNVYTRTVFENEADIPPGLRLGKANFERLGKLVKLRDMLKRQLVLETSDAAKGVMEGNRKALAAAYEAFVKAHGPVNRSTNLRLAMTMPDGGLVAALEVAYQPARTAAQAEKSGLEPQEEISTPAPILSGRVVPKYEPVSKAESPADALAISLAESGRVNMTRIAELLGATEEQAAEQLQQGDSPLVFMDPETQQWETADAYLSGMVKRKLNAARAAGLEVNVKALEAVVPEDWTADSVTVQVGATWVPPRVYAEFLESLAGGNATVTFSKLTNSYSVSLQDADSGKASQWSSDGAPVEYILGRLLNSQSIVVTYTDADGVSRIDRERTELAGLKAREIVSEFADWVFKDGDRRALLVDLFNEKFNTRVVRQFNGQHLTLPGKVPDSIIRMRRHQMNAIWRGVYERFMLVDHAVGAGKTFTAIARAMERRRMGLSRKPMIVVPNHLVEQWAADVYRLYPAAKVLAAGKKDFEAKRRRRLFGKIATGDWDIVIVPHSSFGFIGISPETERRYLEKAMKEALAAIEDAWQQAEEDGVSAGRRKPFGVKEAERLKERIQARMDALNAGARDRLLTFEQLGVDDLTVDEAHEFKNLAYSSRLTGVRGMGDKSGSRKANDLYNKVNVLRENDGAVTFLTGTPISNSAVEMYTMLRYLAADALEEMGMTHFDAFRAQFVEATPAFEPTESGRLKEVTRLGRTWSNMRSLMDLYYSVTDAVSLDDIKRWYSEDNGGKPFPVPKVKGGKDRELVVIKPTAAQETALQEVMNGFDTLEGIQDPDERNAERLRLMDRARKLSLDIRAVDPRHPSKEEGGKLEVVSQNIKRIYDEWDGVRGTQLVFLDRSVPKSKGDDKLLREYEALLAERDEALANDDQDAYETAIEELERYDPNEMEELRLAQASPWNAYQQIKDNLVAMGIPANEIRFIQEASNDEQKAALFDAVNGGKVRVLIGSTPRMGAGTNVQQRIVALHHVDVTWKPSDIEQREGRAIRQGNLFATPPTTEKPNPLYRPDFEVEILAYATERTVDAKMWDLNATKLRTINGIRKYDGAFTMEFEDAESVGMAEMAALASGNPLLLERVKLEADLDRLDLQERAHRRRMYGLQDQLESARKALRDNPARIEQAKAMRDKAMERLRAARKRKEERTVTVEGRTYSDGMEAAQAAQAAVLLQQDGNDKARYAITIDGQRVTTKDGISEAIGAALGDAVAFEANIQGAELFQRTATARRIAELLNGQASGHEGTKTIELGEVYGYQLVADLDISTVQGVRYKNLKLSLMDEGRTVASADAAELQAQVTFVTSNIRAPLDRLVESINSHATSSQPERLAKQMENAERDLPSLEESVGQPFPKAQEKAEKRERLAEVVRLLAADVEQGAPVQDDAEASDANSSDNEDPSGQDVRMSLKGGGRLSGATRIRYLSRAEVQKVAVEVVGDAAARELFVFTTYADLPEKIKADLALQGSKPREVQAFYSIPHNKTFVLDDRFETVEDARAAIQHEFHVHFGLRALYGKELTNELDRMLQGVGGKDELLKLAEQQGIDLSPYERGLEEAENIPEHLKDLVLMEELLAHMGEATGRLRRFIVEFIGLIRRLARKVSGGRLYARLGAFDLALELRKARLAAQRVQDAVNAGDQTVLFRLSSVADQTGSAAFRDWFGESKAVDRDGEPLVLYHGTASDFTVFENRSGSSTGHATSELGYFMTSDRRTAEGYARNASDGMPGLARVMDLYASIKNPYVASLEEMQAIETPVEARRFRAKLEQAGHDGIHIPAAKSWVAFANYQIKSATDNVGTFSEFDPDIRFRLTDFVGRREPFKLSANNAKRALKGRLADLKPALLGALPLMYLRDFAPRNMTALDAYMDEKRAMDADRNELHSRYDDIAQRWLKLRWTDRKAEQRMADLMHAATLAGVDPSMPPKPAYTEEQKAEYNRLSLIYKTLPKGHQAMFREVRDAYKAQVSNLEQVIEDNIARSAEYAIRRARRDRDKAIEEARDELTGPELEDAIEDAEKRYQRRVNAANAGSGSRMLLLRKKFESMRVDEPYFPLKRFGDYFVALRDGTKLVSFSMYEKAADMEAAAEELRKTYPGLTVSTGRQSVKQDLAGAVDPQFVADLQELVAGLPNASELGDQMWQLYLETLPDYSMRKGFIHRKKVPGFARDAMRSFASSMFHSSYQIARLKHSLEMNELVEQVEEQAKESKDPVDAMTVANELRKRHEWVMAPKGGKIAQSITSAAFVYQLGITPAAALVNMTQTWMMGIPVLGTRFGGEGKAFSALTKASADFVRGKGHLEKVLKGDEARAFSEFMRMGLIDKTQAHDLAGVGETGVEYSPVRHKVMGYISWAFHNAERYNREVTAMAAYRLARASGMAHEAAVKEAAELTWTTHFDYSSGNRARYMQGDTAKVLLVFRQHSINMLARMVIDLKDALKGESPHVEKMAKQRLAGIFAMFALFSGVMGIPGMTALLALLDLFDDDDDPWTAEDKMRRTLNESLGPDVARVVLGGAPGAALGVDLTNRIGMGSLWFWSPNRELEGQDAYYYWMEQMLGAAPAMVGNTFTGMSLISKGHVWRGIEAMMPKAVKDAMRSGRYAQEGVQTMAGDALVDEVTTWNLVAQAMGFTPAHIAEQYERNSALKGAEQRIKTERRMLLNRYAMAAKQGDEDARRAVLDRISHFNRRYPQVAITGRTIALSMRAKAQRAARADGGMALDSRLEYLRDEL